MKVLLDVNVLLDVLLAPQPWFAEAAQIWDAHRLGHVTAAIAAFTVPTVFYVVRRQTDLNHAHDAVRICLTTLDVVTISLTTLELARNLPGNDYEDNLQQACAMEAQMDGLVTRDPTGYPGANLPILTPADLLGRMAPRS